MTGEISSETDIDKLKIMIFSRKLGVFAGLLSIGENDKGFPKYSAEPTVFWLFSQYLVILHKG